MGTFKTAKTLTGAAPYIAEISSRIRQDFENDGYDVLVETLVSGACDISITKGGIFKAVLGMKSALKVSLVPQGNDVNFEAGIGIFGQQAIPTVISMFFLWPVLLTQIWGMIQQSKLDDRALEIAEGVVASHAVQGQPETETGTSAVGTHFCVKCGQPVPESAKFCPSCGNML